MTETANTKECGMSSVVSINKVDRYGWADPGDRGEMLWIDISRLAVDHSYQRDEVSESKTLAVAREFSLQACATLVVMQRKDDTMWIVDGQQRWLAAKRRGDIKALPCIVFRSLGPAQEAKAYDDLNRRRTPVRAIDKYRAAVVYGRQPEATIDSWLHQNGMRMVEGLSDPGALSFPALIVSTWKKNEGNCKEALLVQREMVNGETMHVNIHKGLCWLLLRGVDIRREIEKVRSCGGRARMLHDIQRIRIELMAGDVSEVIAGRGILSTINFKRKSGRIKPAMQDG